LTKESCQHDQLAAALTKEQVAVASALETAEAARERAASDEQA
jgi:hypothetical protein